MDLIIDLDIKGQGQNHVRKVLGVIQDDFLQLLPVILNLTLDLDFNDKVKRQNCVRKVPGVIQNNFLQFLSVTLILTP